VLPGAPRNDGVMGSSITQIRNLGDAMAAKLVAAGVADADALRSIGPDAAYARLLQNGAEPHFMAYLAIAMGLEGRHCNAPAGAEKAGLRARFDALKAQAKAQNAKGRTSLDAALAEIGVIEKAAQPTSSRPEKK
jgi:hypothetical protein